MASLDGHKVGGAYVVERSALLHQLSGLARTRPVRQEQQRKRRVLDALAELEQEATARTTRVKLPASARRGLPEGVSLTRPGRISIQFGSPEELLGRVLALSERAARHYQRFFRPIVTPKLL